MQTFLPYADFQRSMESLDYRRLGKQRVEARQILKALTDGGGWSNHPATRMWAGHLPALILYSNLAIEEWVRRGYRNTMPLLPTGSVVLPSWVGNPDLHASHRSNLLRKDPVYYQQHGWTESPDLPYIWPTP